MSSLIAMRRAFHSWPEPGYLEFRTAAEVVMFLNGLNCSVRYGRGLVPVDRLVGFPAPEVVEDRWAEFVASGYPEEIVNNLRDGNVGVVATFEPIEEPALRTIAFRFDVDALPLEEAKSEDHLPFREGFASRNAGYMHACGHDGHAAIGLALARWLSQRPRGRVRIKLIFQAAEEGCRGASAILESSELEDVDELYCFHLGLGAPQGSVSPAVAGMFASTKFRGRFIGRAAHAAASPQDGANALLASCHAILGLHGLPPFTGTETRVNVGTLVCPGAANIVPARADFDFEVRADSRGVAQELRTRAETIVRAASEMHGVAFELEPTGYATTVSCDESAVQVAARAIADAGYPASEAPWKASGSEDASLLIDAVRNRGGIGTYLAIGADLAGPHHSAHFDFNEDSMESAFEVLCQIVRNAEKDVFELIISKEGVAE